MKKKPLELIHFTIACAASYALVGCGTQSFRYTVSDPISLEPTGNQVVEQVFAAEGHGYIWTDCSTANADAINDLLHKAEVKGYEWVADLSWYDYDAEKWIKEPTCRTEYGWLAGHFYTFWWPKATKVKVQAKGVRKEVLADSRGKDPAKSKVLGQNDLGSQHSRRLHPNASILGLELMPGVPFPWEGVGVRVGRFITATKRWAANFELAVPAFEEPGCDSYTSGWGIIAARFEHFLGNSFYYGIGPGLSYQKKCSQISRGSQSHGPESKRVEYGLVGIDAGLGNEWRSTSGLFWGCEWFGGFMGKSIVKRGKGIIAGEKMPTLFEPRFFASYMGASF